MFWRLVLKLLFKASIPLLILVGVLNYGVYMRGGDPLAMWKNVGQNMLTSTIDSSSKALSSLADVKDGLVSTAAATDSKVYTWTDSQGQTHYSTSKPTGIESKQLDYDPDANVVMAFKAPQKKVQEPAAVVEEKPARQIPSSQRADRSNEPELPQIPGLGINELTRVLKERQQVLDSL